MPKIQLFDDKLLQAVGLGVGISLVGAAALWYFCLKPDAPEELPKQPQPTPMMEKTSQFERGPAYTLADHSHGYRQ